MKIAILTSGILPVPSVRGGAVETLIDSYLEYNNTHHIHDITIYSINDNKISKNILTRSYNNKYYFIEVYSFMAKIRKRIFHFFHNRKERYHYSIEFFLHEVIKQIRHQNYDIIIIENRPGFVLKIRKETNAKIIYHLHNDNLNKDVEDNIQIYNYATGIITVSNYISNRVKEIANNDSKCRTVYNGISIHSFKNPKIEITREDLGLTSNDFVIVFCGRIIPEKGIEPLVEAMNILKTSKSIKLLVIGDVEYGNKKPKTEFMHKIRTKAKEYGNVFFTGYVNHYRIAQYLHLADIAVLPSLWEEPFGLTCIESLAAGLPLISTNKGGIPEIVNKECAILVNVNKDLPQTLAQKILYLYNHPEKRLEMSKAAIEQACLFDKDKYAINFFKAIEELIKD